MGCENDVWTANSLCFTLISIDVNQVLVTGFIAIGTKSNLLYLSFISLLKYHHPRPYSLPLLEGTVYGHRGIFIRLSGALGAGGALKISRGYFAVVQAGGTAVAEGRDGKHKARGCGVERNGEQLYQ